MARPKAKQSDFPFWKVEYFETGDRPSGVNPFELMKWQSSAQERKDWLLVRERILKNWILNNPGTRPYAWWSYESVGYRLKVGGIGWTDENFKNAGCGNIFGIPDHYDDDFNCQEKPIFESQAAYLDRHGLLTASERKRLCPADFEPENVSKAL